MRKYKKKQSCIFSLLLFILFLAQVEGLVI
nr:MAG TPA: lyase [Caudoviricetes sp.]